MAETKETKTIKSASTKNSTKTLKSATTKVENDVKEVAVVEAVKKVKKETNAKKIRVTLIKSPIGFQKTQKLTVKALGLGKINSSNEINDNPCVRGMIFKVKHLVRVEEIN